MTYTCTHHLVTVVMDAGVAELDFAELNNENFLFTSKSIHVEMDLTIIHMLVINSSFLFIIVSQTCHHIR